MFFKIFVTKYGLKTFPVKPKSNFMNRTALLFLWLVVVTGCSKRIFMVTTVPDNSLITVSSKTDTAGAFGTFYFKNPSQVKLVFMGKGDSYKIMVNHRGYFPKSCIVSKDSALKMTLAMQRAEGASGTPYDTLKLINASFLILKPNIDITIRSGVGNIIKLRHSDELSRQIADSIYSLLQRPANNTEANFPPLKYSQTLWNKNDPALRKYLLTLNGAKLPYYTYPPSILPFVKGDTALLKEFRNAIRSYNKPYLVYVWAKCIKESTGRIIGNIAMTVAAAGVQGYNQAMYGSYSPAWDPSAFALQTGTKIVYFVIDPETFEVVRIGQKYHEYDLTSAKYIKTFVNEILQYPQLNNH